MLDIKFIRENIDIIKEAARKKHVEVDLDRLIELDDTRRELQKTVEAKKAEQNTYNEKIAVAEGVEKEQLIEAVSIIKEDVRTNEERLKEVMEEWKKLMLQVPNVPDMSVPEGTSDADNVEHKSWGERPTFDFKARAHTEIMTDLDMVDFERGTKVHGFRGYFLKNAGAQLSFAIWNYAINFFMQKEFELMIAPSIARKELFYGTGHLPSDAEDLYETQDGDYLSGTAEVPVMGYHSDETLAHGGLPKKYLAFSPCYRREAGSYGKDTKGLIRVHEFFKIEQVILCEARHDESVKWHELLNRNTEEFIESLGIPYRTVINCGGDLGLGQVKKYDIELWVPLEETYREISSASYFHDFQTRRFNTRYRTEEGKLNYAHSLNCTAIPTPRILVSLIENFQKADGSVEIPQALRPYMNGQEVITRA